jgi:hypothetical protein
VSILTQEQISIDLFDEVKRLKGELEQSQDRERVLQEKLDKIQETHTDNEGYVWEAPTSYAYYTACKALYKHKDRERVLREALEEIKKDLQESYDGALIHSTAFEIVIPIINKALEASK